MRDFVVDSWRFYKANILGLLPLVLPLWVVVQTLTSYWVMSIELPDGAGVTQPIPLELYYKPLGLSLLITPVISAVVILKFTADRMGQSVNAATLYLQAILAWPKMFITTLVTHFMIVIGFMAFIFPGFFALARLAYAPFLVVLENRMPWVAIGESWSGSEPLMKELMFGHIKLVLLALVPYFVVSQAIVPHIQGSLVGVVALNIVMNLVMLIFTAFRFRCYWHWRYEN